MDNFFTSPPLLWLLKEMGIAVTGTVHINRIERAPLKSVKEMEKLERGSSDVTSENNCNTTFVKWKDNKTVTVAFTLYGQSLTKKTQRYIKEKHGRLDIEKPQSIYQYNQEMGRVDRIDQNISAYMTGHTDKEWWWPIFRFCLDLSVNNAYQIYCYRETCWGKKLDLLSFKRNIVNTYYHRYKKYSQSLLIVSQLLESQLK